jgi:hypothetical protein
MGDDPIARLRAQMDQATEGAKEFAGTLAAFYMHLIGKGVTPDHAFGLTRTFLAESLRAARSEQGE